MAALFITGCSDSNKLTGKFSNSDNDGKMIYIFESKSLDKPYEPIDSIVIKSGAFAFDRQPTDIATVSFLAVKEPSAGTPEIIPFINENGKIEVTIDSLATVKGTSMNDEYQKFADAMRVHDKQIETISNEASNIEDDVQLQPYMDQIDQLNKKQAELVYSYIKPNIKNKVGEFFLISYAGLLSFEQVKELVEETSPELQAEMKPMLGMGGNSDGFVGKKFIDVTGETPDGRKIALSDYIGKNKVVLIDFWASWCGPCIKEMPHVVEAYKLYKDKGFEIVGISLDEDKADWTKALKTLDMTWPQMSDLQGWQSKLGAAYSVTSIPFTLLVDQEGNIIAENLRGNALTQKLKEVLN